MCHTRTHLRGTHVDWAGRRCAFPLFSVHVYCLPGSAYLRCAISRRSMHAAETVSVSVGGSANASRTG